MKWLLTLSAETDDSRIRQILCSAGSTLDANASRIPIDGDVVVEVEGPEDLPSKLRSIPEIKAVHPSSEMTLY
jgi:hypothetical protein